MWRYRGGFDVGQGCIPTFLCTPFFRKGACMLILKARGGGGSLVWPHLHPQKEGLVNPRWAVCFLPSANGKAATINCLVNMNAFKGSYNEPQTTTC